MTLIEIGLVVGLVLSCGVMVSLLVFRSTPRQQTQVNDHQVAEERNSAVQAHREGLNQLIETFSARLAAAEGRLTAITAQLGGISALTLRLDGLESHMPSVQEAYEKYADQIGRADKRMTERQRRKEKTDPQTAGEAAAQLASVAGVEAGFPSASATAPAAGNHSTKRPGVLGGAGRR